MNARKWQPDVFRWSVKGVSTFARNSCGCIFLSGLRHDVVQQIMLPIFRCHAPVGAIPYPRHKFLAFLRNKMAGGVEPVCAGTR